MKKNQRGHAMIELAACAGLMVACLGGTFQFGYTFYVYNQLVSAVGNGARYASARTYRAASPKDVERGNQVIRNMVVYGDPHPDENSRPVVPGLKPEEVQVRWNFGTGNTGAPDSVDVAILHHQVDAIFGSFTFAARPSVEFPYLGRYAPAESEP